MTQNLKNAINAQINAEMWSAYLYLAMSLDCEAKGYKGVANWFYVQFQEEQDHARIFMNYLNSRDQKVELLPIAEVPTTWDSVQDMFRQTLEHEKKVTAMIADIAQIADSDRDFASINRIAAWVIGMRSVQKALLSALLTPNADLTALQNKGKLTELMMRQEELKFYPIGDVWEEFCARNSVIGNEGWFDEVKSYENEVLSKRA